MRARHSLAASLLVVAALACASPAAAELYKWVDEKGVVNYGDKPPASAKNVRALDESAARLSIVPGLPPETMQRERERAAEARVGQLERELEESQAREQAAALAAARANERLALREEAQVAVYPIVAPRRHVRPPHAAPRLDDKPVRGRPVQRTRPQDPPHVPAAMRLDPP